MTQSSGFQVSGSAPEHYERFNAVLMAPFVEAIVERAQVQSGASVLDVACGTGFVARRLAEVVGPAGRVAGIDLNPGMVAVAQRVGGPASGAAIEWHEGSALELPFADEAFDAVVCQQGIQFFPDIPVAVSQMHRVLRSGSRAAVTFWASLDSQTYFREQQDRLQRLIGQSMAGAFALDPEIVRRAFVDARFRDIEVARVEPTVVLPNLTEYAMGQVGTLPLAPAFNALDESARVEYVRDLTAALEPHRTGRDEHAMPFVSWIVSGVK